MWARGPHCLYPTPTLSSDPQSHLAVLSRGPSTSALVKCISKVYFQNVYFSNGYFPPPHYPPTLSPTWPSSQEDPQLVPFNVFFKCILKRCIRQMCILQASSSHNPRTLIPTWPPSQEDTWLVFSSVFKKIVIKQTKKSKLHFSSLHYPHYSPWPSSQNDP